MNFEFDFERMKNDFQTGKQTYAECVDEILELYLIASDTIYFIRILTKMELESEKRLATPTRL